MIRALLWDNDGVLVDTEKFYYLANRDELREWGVDLTPDLYLEINLRRGQSVLRLAEEKSPKAFADFGWERVRDRRDARYEAYLRSGVDVIDGVRECLDALHGLLPMAIVTSAPRRHFDIVHAGTDLLRYFEFTLTPDQYGEHKPHPEPYLTAAARLGLAPEECLVVEDSERGLSSATAAGMRCLVVPHALTRDSDFARAHRVLDGIHEVVPEVQGLVRPGA
ncbi:MAG: HAD family hydrolase [Myxococcota bacterium]